MAKEKPDYTYPSNTKKKNGKNINFDTTNDDDDDDDDDIIAEKEKQKQISSLLEVFTKCGLNYKH